MRCQSVSAATRASVTCCDGGLKSIRAERATEPFGTLERGEAATDENLVPKRAVLIEKQNGFSRGTDSSASSRSLNLHQRDQAVDLWLVRNKSCKNSAQAQRIFAQRGAHPVLTSGSGIAFVEDEVDHFENGRQTRGEIRPAGNLKGNARLGQRTLGADDTLGNGGLRDQKGAGDFLRGQAAEQAKRERSARFRGKDRMTRDEHETQKVVADVAVIRDVEIGHGHFLTRLDLAAKLRVLALQELVSAKEVDGAMFSSGH